MDVTRGNIWNDYIIIDIRSGNSIDIEKLDNLDTEEVIVKKREEECC